MISYSEKLKNPRWQRKRLEILDRDDFTCLVCGSADKTLHVHHGAYVKGMDPWDYPSKMLHTLCEGCHSDIGGLSSDIQSEMGALHPMQLYSLLGLVRALRADHAWGEDLDPQSSDKIIDELRKAMDPCGPEGNFIRSFVDAFPDLEF